MNEVNMNANAKPSRRDRHHATVHLAVVVACTALGVATAACGDNDDATARSSQPATTPPAPQSTPHATTTPPAVTPASSLSAPEASASTVVDDIWREEAAAMCAAFGAELPSEPSAAAGVAAWFGFHRDLRDRLPWFEALDLPEELRAAPTDVPDVMRQADEYLAGAETAASAGDDAGIELAVQQYLSLIEHSAAIVTVAGAECGDPTRAANASLNVPVPAAGQVAAGEGSLWASQGPFFTTVTRVDPDSGQVLATIDLGVAPGKIQPANGRMIVRTADSYMAIDPTTNSVVGTLAKSEVGPAANRNWAVDGAMWICDGQRLHRYDPATFAATGIVIELGIDCDQVYATGDLVVASTYNEDEGESGTAAAVFIDPANNDILATTPLPADPTVPIVLDDAVFFPAQKGTVNPVVDRATWTVTATPDYGRFIGGSQMAHDEQSIYIIADKRDVLVIDAQSYEMTDVIEPLSIVGGPNALATTPDALWATTGDAGILQRFDIT